MIFVMELFSSRYVHGMCDPDAEPQQYRQKKEQNPSYEYSCPICKAQMQLTGSKATSKYQIQNVTLKHR